MAQFPNRLAARAHYGVSSALQKIAALTTRVDTVEESLPLPIVLTDPAAGDQLVINADATAIVNETPAP